MFTEFQIEDLKLKNRLVMAPMCMYTADDDGLLKDWHFVHYLTRAIGGVGTIILEATAVQRNGRITPKDLGLWDDNQIPKLKALVDAVHQEGTIIGIQLNHAGRKSQVLEDIVAPSSLSFPGLKIPKALEITEIKEIIQDFQKAALRAYEAGFDFIQIHGAHGYLINQFLSPLTNLREDEYGGSEENRLRFLQEIIDAIKKVFLKPISLRISAEEYHPDGLHPEDHMRMLNKIENINIVNVSTGGVIASQIHAYPGYQLEAARLIKEKTKKVVVAGGLLSIELAEAALKRKEVDLVFFGRELLRNPYFPLQAAKKMNIEQKWPEQYRRAK